jgi:antitoxin (DNA-binding transcriptional repressor) of toxin-antitoxin stability system
MSTTITIDEAQATLKNLIHRLAPGDEAIITENQQPVAKFVERAGQAAKTSHARQLQGDELRSWLKTTYGISRLW